MFDMSAHPYQTDAPLFLPGGDRSPEASAGEVMIYATRPGYAMSYLLGYDGIMARREARRGMVTDSPNNFNLKAFHEVIGKTRGEAWKSWRMVTRCMRGLGGGCW
jgi:hypothetical protein